MAEKVLFQHNTLASLMAGLYRGTMPLSQLLEHGDLGIGTLDYIDGELIILDGKAYHAIGTGDKAQVIQLDGSQTVPYAAVVKHVADQSFAINQEMSDLDLKEKLEAHFGTANLFQSLKITGRFKKIHVRMIQKSDIGPAFAEVAKNQPEYTEEEVDGTLVGFWTPELFHGVSVAGYHLHFLSDDKQFGGHVMDFQIQKGQVEIAQIDALVQDFPKNSQAFKEANFDVDQLRQDIATSE